jgi:ligand-binding SRPBCC domain-containing protein
VHLRTETWLPVPRERVFAFFAEAENLQRLTPTWLGFTILTPRPIPMGRGTLIDYRISLRGIPMKWRTEISTWEPPDLFVDSQLRGPYRRWIHTHRFSEVNGGTRVEDRVDFDMLFGRLMLWYVARDLRKIFTYRHQALRDIFALPDEAAPKIEIYP